MPRKDRRVRADELVIMQGFANSLDEARAKIIAGDVRAGDRLIGHPSEPLDRRLRLRVTQQPKYVSRGGTKLEAVFAAHDIEIVDRVAADIGASAGGFTDFLLKGGASRVYAIDAGFGQLDYRLRVDDRVVVMERTNARHLKRLPELVQLVTIDVSFISLSLILPVAAAISDDNADVIALVKPQFEADRKLVNRQGVVTDERVREDCVRSVIDIAGSLGLTYRGMLRSPLTGPAGNEEFFVWFDKSSQRADVERDLARVFNRPDA